MGDEQETETQSTEGVDVKDYRSEVEVFERTDGDFDWRLKTRQGEILCSSDQGYTERNDAVEGYQRVKEYIHHNPAIVINPAVNDPVTENTVSN